MQSATSSAPIKQSSSRKHTRKLPVLEFDSTTRLLKYRLPYKDALIDVYHNHGDHYEVYLDEPGKDRFVNTQCIAWGCDLIEATCLVYQLLSE